jgi:hypothetical protein
MEPLTIAYYVTGHGLGHATRSLEVGAAKGTHCFWASLVCYKNWGLSTSTLPADDRSKLAFESTNLPLSP